LVRPLKPATDAAALRALHSLIKSFSPAIVHTHMAKAGTIARAAAITSTNRPLLVHTFHGHVLEGYFKRPLRDAFLATERFLGSRTDALVAVSDEIRDQLLDLGIGHRDKWRVIPLGFDLSEFLGSSPGSGPLKRELNLPEGAALVGIVGRLVPIKDHETALRAIAELPEHVHLAIVGDGEDRAKIETLVDSLGLRAQVHLLGWRMDVQAVMSSLDVALLSSRNEGSPVALIEALANGVPVVSTDVGGVRSVVQEGVSGYLVPPGASTAMAEAIWRLLTDPSGSREMGAAGRAYVTSRFDQTRLVNDIRSLYAHLLAQRQ
jgi:glycosyltransferase involved in cell wall biosynthesis